MCEIDILVMELHNRRAKMAFPSQDFGNETLNSLVYDET